MWHLIDRLFKNAGLGLLHFKVIIIPVSPCRTNNAISVGSNSVLVELSLPAPSLDRFIKAYGALEVTVDFCNKHTGFAESLQHRVGVFPYMEVISTCLNVVIDDAILCIHLGTSTLSLFVLCSNNCEHSQLKTSKITSLKS